MDHFAPGSATLSLEDSLLCPTLSSLPLHNEHSHILASLFNSNLTGDEAHPATRSTRFRRHGRDGSRSQDQKEISCYFPTFFPSLSSALLLPGQTTSTASSSTSSCPPLPPNTVLDKPIFDKFPCSSSVHDFRSWKRRKIDHTMFNRSGRGRDKSPKLEISSPMNVQRADPAELLQSLSNLQRSPATSPAAAGNYPRRNSSLPRERTPLIVRNTDTSNLPRSTTSATFPMISSESEVTPHDEAVRSHPFIEGDRPRTLRSKRSFFKDASQKLASMVPSSRHRAQSSMSAHSGPTDTGDENSQLGPEYVFDFDTAQRQIDSNTEFSVLGSSTQTDLEPQESKSLLTSPKVRRFFGHETERDEQEQRLRQLSISKNMSHFMKDDKPSSKLGYRVQGDEVLHDDSADTHDLPHAVDSGEGPSTISRQPYHSGHIDQMKSVYEGSDEELIGRPFTVSGHGLTGQSPVKDQASEHTIRKIKKSQDLSAEYGLQYSPTGLTVNEMLLSSHPANYKYKSFSNYASSENDPTRATGGAGFAERAKSGKKTGLLSGLMPYSEPSVASKVAAHSENAGESKDKKKSKWKGKSKEVAPPPPPPKDANLSDEYEPLEVGTARAETITRIPAGTARIVDILSRKKHPASEGATSPKATITRAGPVSSAPESPQGTTGVHVLAAGDSQPGSHTNLPQPPRYDAVTASASSIESRPNPLRSNVNPLHTNAVPQNEIVTPWVGIDPPPPRTNAVTALAGSGSGPNPPNGRRELRASATVDSPWKPGPLNMNPAMQFAEPPDWIRNSNWWADHKATINETPQEELHRSFMRSWGNGDIPTGPQNRAIYAEDWRNKDELKDFIRRGHEDMLADSPLKRILCGCPPGEGPWGPYEDADETPRQSRRQGVVISDNEDADDEDSH